MRKKLLIAVIALVIIASIIGGYCVFNNVCPKANKIIYPDIENIFSASVTCNDGDEFVISNSDFEELILNINNAKPTRRKSLNDYPTVRPYYTVIIETTQKQYHYFVYEEGSHVYIEIPYEGIYMSDEQTIDLLIKYYEER